MSKKQVAALLSTNRVTPATAPTEAVAEPQSGLASVRRAVDDNLHGGLTFEQLASALADAAQLNNLANYYSLADKLEELDPQYRSLISTRKYAVLGCKWDIKPKDNTREQKKKADYFKRLVEEDWVPDLQMQLLDAISKGSAVAENMYSIAPDGSVSVQPIERPLRFFEFDKTDGNTLRLKTGLDTTTELPAAKFIVHQPAIKSGLPIKRGLAFCGLGVWLAKALMQKNMWSYTERAGQPFRYVTYAEGTPEKRIKRMAQVMSALGTDTYAVFPKDFEMNISNAMATGNIQAFETGLRYSDEQMAKLVLGQTKTSDGQGGSNALAQTHNEVRLDIVRSDARQLCATLKRDLFRHLCVFNFGNDDLPDIELELDETVDNALEAEIFNKLASNGIEFSQAEIRAKFGYRDPEPGEPTTKSAQQGPAAGLQSTNRCPVHGTHAEQTRDALDGLSDSMEAEWERVSAPILDEMLQAAEAAKDPEELAKALASVAENKQVLAALQSILASGRFQAEVVGRAGGDIGDGDGGK